MPARAGSVPTTPSPAFAVESSEPSVSVSQDGESLNYGVGATWYAYGDNGLRADWTRRDFSDGGEADVWSLSYIRRF